ncbi:MAG: hypothetical protein QM775_23970 [Pirellulales bacterium]
MTSGDDAVEKTPRQFIACFSAFVFGLTISHQIVRWADAAFHHGSGEYSGMAEVFLFIGTTIFVTPAGIVLSLLCCLPVRRHLRWARWLFAAECVACVISVFLAVVFYFAA